MIAWLPLSKQNESLRDCNRIRSIVSIVHGAGASGTGWCVHPEVVPDFCTGGGTILARESGETMKKRARRNHPFLSTGANGNLTISWIAAS